MSGVMLFDDRSPHATRKIRRWTVAMVLLAAATSAFFLWMGLHAQYAAMLGVSLLLVAAVVPIAGVPATIQFRRLPYASRDGTRREVSTLTWSLYGNRSTLREPAVRRLHQAGIRACRHAGLDLGSPDGRSRAHDLLGSRTLAFLDDPQTEPVDADRMRAHLTAFERLDLRKGTL